MLSYEGYFLVALIVSQIYTCEDLFFTDVYKGLEILEEMCCVYVKLSRIILL